MTIDNYFIFDTRSQELFNKVESLDFLYQSEKEKIAGKQLLLFKNLEKKTPFKRMFFI